MIIYDDHNHQARHPAEYEGQSHAQYLFDDTAPEAREAFGEIAGFFDRHLGT
jgi:acetyl esterase/lipase